MNIIGKELKHCISCMEEHDVYIVQETENMYFNGINVVFNVVYEYCSNTDEYTETEDMMHSNNISMKKSWMKESEVTNGHLKALR